MSMYFLLGTLTRVGQEMLSNDPDLINDTTRHISVDGAEILGQYAVLGRYDFVTIVEADDNDAVARLSLEFGVRTGLHLETMPAMAIGALAERNEDISGGDVESIKGPTVDWKLPRN
jgi:uncharacterized protein with GYD domain